MDIKSIWQKTSEPFGFKEGDSAGRHHHELPRCSPCDMAELHSDALRHTPLLGKHAPVLLLVVHQLTLYPSITPVNLIQPGHLNKTENIIFNSSSC